MIRDVAQLANRNFDLLVIGGGIYGLTIAADAAQRGLTVALIEQNDFGSGISFNHLRTIHGGLRYLQTLDVARARESIVERRTLAQIAPWAVKPLPFVLPLQSSITRGRAALTAAFLLDRFIARDRNENVPASHILPLGRVLGRAEALRAYPELAASRLTSAAVWYDYVTTDADRLTLAWALSACEHGAVLANYVEATALLAGDGRVRGAKVTDRVTGDELNIRALTVVNATGSALNALLSPFKAAVDLPLVQAMNLVSTRPDATAAFGGVDEKGRTLFAVPWQDRTLFGTSESTALAAAGNGAVDDAAVEAFLADVNAAFPSARLVRTDITLVHRGLVPAAIRANGSPTLRGDEAVFDHGAAGLTGVISVAGTKYTTARSVGARIVDRLYQYLGRPVVESRSGATPLPHVALIGHALMEHAARHEMVVTLADAVMRRTPLGATGRPDNATLTHAAAVVGNVLGWSDDRRHREIEAVRHLY